MRAVSQLLDLAEHYSPAQIESLLEPEALLLVYQACAEVAPSPMIPIRERLESGDTPGVILLALTDQFGAEHVWRALSPRFRKEGAEDEPAPIPAPEVHDLTRQQLALVIVSTICVLAPAATHLAGAPAASWTVLGLVLLPHLLFAGWVFRGPGILGAAVAQGVGLAVAMMFAAWDIGLGRISLISVAGIALACGALVGLLVHSMQRSDEAPVEF